MSKDPIEEAFRAGFEAGAEYEKSQVQCSYDPLNATPDENDSWKEYKNTNTLERG